MGKTCEPRSKKSWITITYLVAFAVITAGLLMVPSSAMAVDRLSDSELDDLLDSLEKNRETFEAALDADVKNSILVAPRGEVDVNGVPG